MLDGVACRACGAVRAPRASDGALPNVCGDCWRRFQRNRKLSVGALDDDFTLWLSSRLLIDLRRIGRTGVAGRCQAISRWTYGNFGFQCARSATLIRGAYRVCEKHAAATAPKFLNDDPERDPYQIMEGLMRAIAQRDARFADMLHRVTAAPLRADANSPTEGYSASGPTDATRSGATPESLTVSTPLGAKRDA